MTSCVNQLLTTQSRKSRKWTVPKGGGGGYVSPIIPLGLSWPLKLPTTNTNTSGSTLDEVRAGSLQAFPLGQLIFHEKYTVNFPNPGGGEGLGRKCQICLVLLRVCWAKPQYFKVYKKKIERNKLKFLVSYPISLILPNHYVHPGYHEMRTHRRRSVHLSIAVGQHVLVFAVKILVFSTAIRLGKFTYF